MRDNLHVVVCSFHNPGRINPIVAIAEALVKAGVRVTCYGESSTKETIVATGADYRDYFRSLSSKLQGYDSPDEYFAHVRQDDAPAFLWNMIDPLLYMDAFVQEIKGLQPDLLFYDPALIEVVIASETLSIPRVALITNTGPGVWGDKLFKRSSPESWKDIVSTKNMQDLRKTYKARFGIDPLDHGLPIQFYSKRANIVSFVEQLTIPLSPVDDPFVYSRVGKQLPMTFVGPCISETCRSNGSQLDVTSDTKKSSDKARSSRSMSIEEKESSSDSCSESGVEEVQCIIDQEYPLERLKRARANGMKVVYFALGTVITKMLWKETPGMRVGGACSGKQLLGQAINVLIEAVESIDNVLVVINVGIMPDAASLIPPRLRSDSKFIIRQRSPQVKALTQADVFVTHAGAGSTQETLLAGVPSIIIPGFGDQLSNGEILVREGAGIMDWDPVDAYSTMTPIKLKRAVLKCLYNHTYRDNAQRLGQCCRQSGGPHKAAKELITLAHQLQSP